MHKFIYLQKKTAMFKYLGTMKSLVGYSFFFFFTLGIVTSEAKGSEFGEICELKPGQYTLFNSSGKPVRTITTGPVGDGKYDLELKVNERGQRMGRKLRVNGEMKVGIRISTIFPGIPGKEVSVISEGIYIDNDQISRYGTCSQYRSLPKTAPNDLRN